MAERIRSAAALRRELAARGLERGANHSYEVGYSQTPAVVYAENESGEHGNFLPASYRRILADPAWARRLEKTYTGSRLLPRRTDRWRGELECATSSDALLMNIFCFPGVLRRPAVCALLEVETGLRPSFGVRADLPMCRGEVDRTEFDMQLGTTLAEAKLTEGGFGKASLERVLRYDGVREIFEIDLLPRAGTGVAGYQLVRGVLAAVACDGSYLLLLDERRADLQEVCLRVLAAVYRSADRNRLRLRTWQELAAALPKTLQVFLAEKYGIERR